MRRKGGYHLNKTIYRNIEAERGRCGLTKEALSQRLGITTKTYLNWIRGTTEIPANQIKEMK